MTQSDISEHLIEQYQHDGVALIRGVFRDWVERVAEGIEYNMANPSADVRIYKNDDGSGLFFGDYCNWDRIPAYREFVYDSPAAAVVKKLTRSRKVRFFHEHVLVKEPGTNVPTPWHQDQPYYCVDGLQTCSLWMPLDNVSEAVCPQFVAGSHRWQRFFRPERFNRTPLNEDDELEAIPDIDNNRDHYDIRAWALQPGDAIAFNFMTVHGAPANTSDTRRRGFSNRWVGDDCTFARRPGVTSPPFRDITLAHGAPMDAPEFPLVGAAN
jgi:ectoine hydroxylase-related dioxygenase (phytanoyl-CoA dioxygenase family)